MRLLITRPEEDSRQLAEALAALGHEVVPGPLLEIAEIADAPLDMEDVTGLLVTSANGLRAFARRIEARDLPVWAVGDASARCARDFGFTRVESAAGDVEALAALVADRVEPGAGVLLHPAGSKVAGDLAGRLEASGHRYRRAVLYEARKATRLPGPTAEGLKAGRLDGVLFFSPRTAETFVALAKSESLGDTCRAVTAFCLSAAVAERAGELRWKEIVTAARPEQAALLECIGKTDIVAPRR